MSTYLPTPEVDLPVASHAELGFYPDIDIQACTLPPLSSSQVPLASSPLASPFLPSSYYPKIVPYPVQLNRHICDLNTPSYEPKPVLWTTENGEIPDLDAKVYTDDYLKGLAQRFPQYTQLISAVDAHDPQGVKKVRNLIMQYMGEEREKSWGSTVVVPQITWQDPAENWQELDEGTHSQPQDLDDAADVKPKPKRVNRKRRAAKFGSVSKRKRRGRRV